MIYSDHLIRMLCSPQCAVCEQDILLATSSKTRLSSMQNNWVCETCYPSLPFHSRGCELCGTHLNKYSTAKAQPPEQLSNNENWVYEINNTSEFDSMKMENTTRLYNRRCGQCLVTPGALDQLTAAFNYQYPIRQWLARFKFQRHFALANWFAVQLAQQITQSTPPNLPDLIVPVPLHPRRISQRGYNQSLLIARRLAAQLNRPLLSKGIVRTRYTEAQSELSQRQRRKNIRGAFKVLKRMPKQVAIVDDVFTTGATLNQLALELKRQGAESVFGWVVAYAPLGKPN